MKRIYMRFSAVLAARPRADGVCSSGRYGEQQPAPAGWAQAQADHLVRVHRSARRSAAHPVGAGRYGVRPRTQANYPAGTRSITIGSAAFPENVSWPDIYAGAMSAKGARFHKKDADRRTPGLHQGPAGGSIDMSSQYSGSILYYFD